MKGNCRRLLYEQVVTAIADATTDPKRGCIKNQVELAQIVQCSTATLSAEMPGIVAASARMHPGYCIQTKPYRLVTRQTAGDVRESRRRLRGGITKAARTVNEVDIAEAGPEAIEAISFVKAAGILLNQALEKLDAVADLIEMG